MNVIGKYKEEPFPENRKFIIDTLEEGARKHLVYGLLELDITHARKSLRARRRETGQYLSFTGWMVKCVSQAVSENKGVQAYRHGRNKLVVFEDVDVAIAVERFVNRQSISLPYIVRKANEKSVAEISEEIQSVKTEQLEEGEVVLGEIMNPWMQKLANLAPAFIRKLYWKRLLSDAYRIKKTMGTVIVTSVSMFANTSGYVLPVGIHTLGFGLGGIVKKPGISGDKIEPREYLNLTIYADHDVIDGAPLARFTRRLVELVECAYGIKD